MEIVRDKWAGECLHMAPVIPERRAASMTVGAIAPVPAAQARQCGGSFVQSAQNS
jgi:hypothetical protein